MNSHGQDDSFPLRTCTHCGNVLIFTYTCHSRSDSLHNFDLKMAAGESWQFICRACRSIQILHQNELICTRDQLCRLLGTRGSLLDRVIPEHPRPRQFGEAGKVTVDDLKPIMGQSAGS